MSEMATATPSNLVVETEGFDVSETSAWIILVVVCVFFTILSFGSMDKFNSFLPEWCTNLCLLNKRGKEANTDEYFLAARNATNATSIALSYFASGMGAWVVYGSTEMGANPQLSWLGVIGYSVAGALPGIAVCFLGPMFRHQHSSGHAFSISDFGRERYGRLMHLSITLISVFYMFIFIVAELTSISNVYALLTNNLGNKWFGIGVTIVIGFFTLFYTAVGGLPSSIVTDKFQGFLMAFLVIVLTIAVCALDENQVTREEFKLASNWTVDGFMAMVTLFIAVLAAEMFNQATWQRVYAAESDAALRKGFGIGAFLVFLLMMFFGIMGMIAYAKDPVSYDTFEKYYYLAFFDLLLPLKNGWHILVLIFVTALAASSIDSLQNGLNSVCYRDALKLGCNPHVLATTLVVVVNIPAIYMASKKFEILGLFLVADLVCAAAVLPVFLGLQRKDKLGGLLPAPTELGSFLGIISGLGSVLVNGHINGAVGFQYFWLDNGAICSLCGSETMISFIVTPLVGGLMTYVFTHISLLILGDRARRPVFERFTGEFDKDIESDSDEDDNDAPLKVKEILDIDDDEDMKTSGKTEDIDTEAPSQQLSMMADTKQDDDEDGADLPKVPSSPELLAVEEK